MLHNHLLFVSLPKEFLKKGYNMALKIKNREEAIAVLRDMVQRKRKWRNKFKKNLPKYVKKQKIHSLAKRSGRLYYIIILADKLERTFACSL